MPKITERTLRKWRREALVNSTNSFGYGTQDPARKMLLEAQERILSLTQILLDQALLEETRREITQPKTSTKET